jgi:hypothetical protein
VFAGRSHLVRCERWRAALFEIWDLGFGSCGGQFEVRRITVRRTEGVEEAAGMVCELTQKDRGRTRKLGADFRPRLYLRILFFAQRVLGGGLRPNR